MLDEVSYVGIIKRQYMKHHKFIFKIHYKETRKRTVFSVTIENFAGTTKAEPPPMTIPLVRAT